MTKSAAASKMGTRNNPSDTPLTEEEPDWHRQFKENSDERFRNMEERLEAMQLKSDAKHAELLQLLLQQKQSQPPPTSSQPPAPPKSSSATAGLFNSSPAASGSFHGSTNMFPISAAPVNQTHPTVFPTRSSSAMPFTGNFYSSNLVYDEHGFPLPGVLPGAHETHSATHEQIFGNEQTFGRTEEMQMPPHHTPPGFPFGNRGPPTFMNGHTHGLGPSGDKVWVSGTDYRLRKLKMPLFEGEDAYGWVYRIERFFDIQGLVTSGERLKAAVLCMEGPALSWYRWTDSREPFRSWEHLKVSLLDRFQPSLNGGLYEQFLNIKQEGTARNYVSMFEALAAQLPGISEQVLEGTFLKGLKHDLRTSVRVLQPAGLRQAMKLAVMIHESQTGTMGVSAFDSVTGDQGRNIQRGGNERNFGVKTPAIMPSGNSRPTPTENKSTFKRMTDSELAEKRAKGLCFKCDEKFGPGHRCPEKSLRIMVVHEGEETEDDEGEGEEEGEHVHLDMVEVSAQSIAGITTPRTMKIRGLLCGIEVMVLIDSGATHNFVSLRLVEPLRLAITGTKETWVILGNGKTEKSYGICRGLELQLPELTISEDFLPLDLGSTDVILGVKWLRRLGDTHINWRKLTMSFLYKGGKVTLNGETGLHRGAPYLHARVRGLTRYYRRFAWDYRKIIRILTGLWKRDGFRLTDETTGEGSEQDQQQSHDPHLEDKVSFWGGSDDMNQRKEGPD